MPKAPTSWPCDTDVLAHSCLAPLMVLIWHRRLGEVALGSFGLLCSLVPIRYLGYDNQSAFGVGVLSDFLFFTAQILTRMTARAFPELSRRAPKTWGLITTSSPPFGGLTLLAA